MSFIQRFKRWLTDHQSPYAALDITEIKARMRAIESKVGQPLLDEYIALRAAEIDYQASRVL